MDGFLNLLTLGLHSTSTKHQTKPTSPANALGPTYRQTQSDKVQSQPNKTANNTMPLLTKIFAPYSDYTLSLPWVVRVIFYQLPPLVKPIVLRICLLPNLTQVSIDRLTTWCYNWKTLKQQILINSDDNLWKFDETFFTLNPFFQTSLRHILTMSDWNIFSPIFDPEPYLDIIQNQFDSISRSSPHISTVFPTKEEMIHSTTSYSPNIQLNSDENLTDFHSLLLSFFNSSNLPFPISSTLNHLELFDSSNSLTQNGFHFLFRSPKHQIQSFCECVLLQSLKLHESENAQTSNPMKKRNKPNNPAMTVSRSLSSFRDVLTDWFFRLWFITPGMFYSFPEALKPTFSTLQHFQLLTTKTKTLNHGGKNLKSNFVTTTNLFSFLSHPLSHSHLSSFSLNSAASTPSITDLHGKLICETNFKVYCYDPTPLQKKLLPLFLDWEEHLENLSIGILTRSSVRNALTRGISADSIVQYLQQNIHPQISSIPKVIIEQLHHWENSRLKIVSYPRASLLTVNSKQELATLRSRLLRQRYEIKYTSSSEPWQLCVLDYQDAIYSGNQHYIVTDPMKLRYKDSGTLSEEEDFMEDIY